MTLRLPTFLPATLLAAATLCGAASAQADQGLAASRNCMACHGVDRKLVGPAFKAVATRYAGQNATDALAAKIVKGGAGAWGPVPMPANPQVSPAEAKALATWVLGLK